MPMPWAAPVTIATLPSSLAINPSLDPAIYVARLSGDDVCCRGARPDEKPEDRGERDDHKNARDRAERIADRLVAGEEEIGRDADHERSQGARDERLDEEIDGGDLAHDALRRDSREQARRDRIVGACDQELRREREEHLEHRRCDRRPDAERDEDDRNPRADDFGGVAMTA